MKEREKQKEANRKVNQYDRKISLLWRNTDISCIKYNDSSIEKIECQGDKINQKDNIEKQTRYKARQFGKFGIDRRMDKIE